ncbi:hypothetical protein [Candidatus Formimonas warabiya]|uniref:Uncharacterized protein n=1 Tax=Formimonas warabiya TaxID=1761012 RepID=A0A3G1KNW4_FORW1|nr:hypothetical protein [Candidatus Formimonas warabiya]ATW24163.1 hypothetical protein DCMF_04635 [Candidatus Formimonas warabiya]
MITTDDMDFIRECLSDVAGDVEESIVYKKYLNTTPGDQVMGIPDTPNYESFDITARVRALTLEEIQVSGGAYIFGDVEFKIRKQDWMQWDLNLTGGYDPESSTIRPDYPDRIIYDGLTYKPKSYSHAWLGGVLWYKVKAGKL